MIDKDMLEDIIVDIAKRSSRRIKQKSFKDFDATSDIVCELYNKSTSVSKIVAKDSSTKKDIQSKLKEVAVACILGIEFLERDSEIN